MAILYRVMFFLTVLTISQTYPFGSFPNTRSRRLPNPRQIYRSQSMLLRGRRQGNPLSRDSNPKLNKNSNLPLNQEPLNQNQITATEKSTGVDSSQNRDEHLIGDVTARNSNYPKENAFQETDVPSNRQSPVNQKSNFVADQDRFAQKQIPLFRDGNLDFQDPNIPYSSNQNSRFREEINPAFKNLENPGFPIHQSQQYDIEQPKFLPNPNPTFRLNPNSQYRPDGNPPFKSIQNSQFGLNSQFRSNLNSDLNSHFVQGQNRPVSSEQESHYKLNHNPLFNPSEISKDGTKQQNIPVGSDQNGQVNQNPNPLFGSHQDSQFNQDKPRSNQFFRPEENVPIGSNQSPLYASDLNPSRFGLYQSQIPGSNEKSKFQSSLGLNPLLGANQNPSSLESNQITQFGQNQNSQFNGNPNQFMPDRNLPNSFYQINKDPQFTENTNLQYQTDQHNSEGSVLTNQNQGFTNNANPSFGSRDLNYLPNIGEEQNNEISSERNSLASCDKSLCTDPPNCMNVTESADECCPTCETHGCQCEGYQYYDCVSNGFKKGMVPEGKSYSVDSGSTVCSCPTGGGAILCSYQGFADSPQPLFEQNTPKLLCPEPPSNCIKTLTREDGCVECLGVGCISDDGTKHPAGASVARPSCVICYCPTDGGDFFCGNDPNCKDSTETRHSSLESTQRVLQDPLKSERGDFFQDQSIRSYDNTGYDTRFLQPGWNNFDSQSSQQEDLVVPRQSEVLDPLSDNVVTPLIKNPRVPLQSEVNNENTNSDENSQSVLPEKQKPYLPQLPSMPTKFGFQGYNPFGYSNGQQYSPENYQYGYNGYNHLNQKEPNVGGSQNSMTQPEQSNRFYKLQQPVYEGFYPINHNFNGYTAPRKNEPALTEVSPDSSDPSENTDNNNQIGPLGDSNSLENTFDRTSSRNVAHNFEAAPLRPEVYVPELSKNNIFKPQTPGHTVLSDLPKKTVNFDTVEPADPGFVNESSRFENVLSACCYQGKQWALSHSSCSGIEVTVNSYAQTCAVAQEKCCLETKTQEQCQAGITTARSMLACVVPNTLNEQCDRNGYKSCCDCCALGLKAYVLSLTCDMNILGEPCNSAFKECCAKGRLLQPPTDNRHLLFTSSIASSLPTSSSPTVPVFEGPRCTTHNKCEQVCIDSNAGMECHCRSGYQLNRDNTTCKDVNECVLGTHTCKVGQFCLNTPGGFTCQRLISCGTGYELTGTNTCNDIDECELGLDDCGSRLDCVNVRGSFRCVPKLCDAGYFTDATGRCIDIDECRAGDYTCPPRSTCENTVGSYACFCPAGFTINEAGDMCIDVDECALGTNNCEEGSTCENTNGHFTCHRPKTIDCGPGYQPNLDQTSCVDIDECLEGTHKCNEGSTCINVEGGFRCQDPLQCNKGMRPSHNQKNCIDIDECVENNLHQCGVGGVCVNIPGSYRCDCSKGYTEAHNSTGMSCKDINECESNIGTDCVFRCINNPGSYRCVCPNGYNPINYGKNCEDINECESGQNNCAAGETCFNTKGSFRCVNLTCPANYATLANRRCVRKSCRQSEDKRACSKLPKQISFYNISAFNNAPSGKAMFRISLTRRSPNDRYYFFLTKGNDQRNFRVSKKKLRKGQTGIVYTTKTLKGPQNYVVDLTLKLYRRRRWATFISRLYISVSAYEF